MDFQSDMAWWVSNRSIVERASYNWKGREKGNLANKVPKTKEQTAAEQKKLKVESENEERARQAVERKYKEEQLSFTVTNENYCEWFFHLNRSNGYCH